MGDTKLCLMLLLSAAALAHADDETPCLMAKRYKPFHKYEYLYEAESLNFLNGAVNGPKGSCKVEIEVPGPCHYIVRTTECTLSEVTDFNAEGHPVFAPAATSDAFKAAMEKNTLKVIIKGDNDIKLFPEDGELINILNIKRGIISAFAVPVLKEEGNKRMPTIFGLCKTDYTVNAREDIATDVTLTRDLSRCDHFRPVSDYTSPLALITGMHYSLSKMIRSTQTCNYQFDNAQHHPTGGECIENHILVPFSHKGKFGVTNISKQKATLLAVTEYNDRVFNPNLKNEQTLHPHASVDKSPIQDKDAALALLRELAGLSKTDDGHKRAHLAHKIISMIRKMSAETLHAVVPEALEISPSLTYQALFQCGTPECNNAITRILKTFDSSSMEIDAIIYAMGLLPKPSRQLVSDMLEMAKFKQSKPIFYGASNAVKRLYQAEGKVTPEIEAVANLALEQIGDCTGNQEHIFMSLKVIGNMAAAMGAASPALKSAVIQCVNQPAASPKVQLAAIQAYRQTTLPEEGRQVLMQVLLDGAAPLQKRVAAYLVLMKDPQPAELSQLVAALKVEDSQQAKNFIISHITNILSSTTPETRGLRQKILDALQGNEVGTVNSFDAPKFSRNYKVGSLEGNMIFEGNSYLPKEVVLDMSLNAFGFDVDMFEVGIETNGIEQTSDALFGTDGFFNDIATKSIDHANEMLPGGVMYGMVNMIPPQFYTRKKRKASQSLIKDLRESFHQLLRNLKAQGAPEAMVYLRMLGMELGYLKTEDLERMVLPCLHTVALMIDNLQRSPTDFIQELLPNGNNELFAHYIFMDNEFYLPTGPGVPLRVALSGTFTPGVKGGVHLAADMSEVAFMPSVGIEFVTEVGAHFPDFVQSGLEMHTNIYHETGLKAKVSVSHNNIKLTIPAPQSPTKLISLTNSLVSVHGTKTKAIPPTGDKVDVTECTPFFAGVKYCTALQYSDALHTDDSPYFPFTGDSKLTIQLHPTGEVSEYIANFDHSYEDNTDMVTLTLKAEGLAASESTVTVKFNRRTGSAGIDLQVPDYDLEVGLRLGSVNPNTKGKATHSVQLDLVNKNIPQMSIIVLAKLKEKKDFSVEVQCLVPPVADFKVATHFHYEKDLGLEMKTDLKMLAINYVQNITLKYDEGELAAEIKAELSSEIKNMLSDLKYVETLLNQNIGQTRMRAGTFFRESVEKAHEVIKKYGGEVVRLAAFSELSFPEKLYWKVEADAKYSFGECYTISIPLFEKTSRRHFILPEEFFPEQVSVSVPVLGKAEVSGKVDSNFYKLEADFSAGRDPLDHPSYNAKWEVTWTCPSEILSLKTDGSALLVATTSDSLKAELKTHVNHRFIDATITVEEVATIADEFSLMSSCTFEATNPLGVQVSLDHTGDASFNGEVISGNGNLQASLKAGPVYSASTISQTVNIFPYKPKAKSDSSLKIDSTFIASFKNELLKSDLDYMILRTSKPTYTSDFKLRENLNADLLVASHLDFKGSIETESPIMEIILLTGSEETPLSDIKLDIKANHNIDLPNALIGTLYNSIDAMVKPTEVLLDSQNRAMINLAGFQNEGNAQASLKDVTAGKLHLQNDYSVTFNSNVQHASNIGLVRLNQDRLGYNFTVDNNQAEIGIYAAVDGKINLDFLTVPISIPELKVPIIDFRTPAINGINLYEHTGLKDLLTSTDQTVDANAKIIFTKSKNSHLRIFLYFLPNLDHLDSEVSFKSSIMNLNVSSEVTDRNVHIVAISTSMFESLEAKLEYTTIFDGWNAATSLSLDNPHVKVTQNSTQAFLKYFSAMAAKVNLPIFTAEVNEQSIFNHKDNTFYNYTYEMVYTVNVPVINAVGSGNVESSTRFMATKRDGEERATYMSKTVTPVYKTVNVIEMEGLYPTYNGTFRANAQSPAWFLDYDLDGSFTLSIGNEAVNHTVKSVLVLADTDLIVDVQHAVQHLDEGPSYTVNVDITSPFFTDVNVRYAAYQDGANISISTPSTGSLGFQHQDKSPQMRLYCRYASEPDNDMALLDFEAALTDNEMLHLHASANVDAPAVILSGLYDRVPAITSSVRSFAEKYKISSTLESLKDMVLSVADEVSNSAGNYVPELSQLSVLFRNVVGQCLKAAQALLDAAIKFLRETQNMESIDVILQKLGVTLREAVDTAQEFVDSVKSDILDSISGCPRRGDKKGPVVVEAIKSRLSTCTPTGESFIEPTMGDTKLCLMLLLSAAALAHADDETPCLMAKRYKPFHKYEYLYEAESLNFLNGAVNGPKGSCKVEIEVPGPCHYIVRTTECTLSEVTDFDAEGHPVFAPAATSDAFKAAMEKNTLKVIIKGDNDIKLFPEDGELINILNIKRGIISAFAVPVLKEEGNKRMPTIFGLCKTDYTVNAREDIATDVTLTRDLSRCDHFRPVSDYTSPLALITGMHYSLSKMIRSTQTCNYQFDNAQHHPTGGECIENHILVPFSHKGKFGVTNVSKQKATLLAVTEYNDRVFNPNLKNEQTLHPHASVDKSPIQDKDAALALLRELAGLSKTDDGHKRAHLAHKIVSMIRKMSAETLHAVVPEALEISPSLTYQALFQCGTPECNNAITRILKTFDSSSMEIDAIIYAMGLLPKPSRQLVSDMLEMAKFKQSKPIFYGASNAVKRLYQAEGKVTPEIEAVANFALEQIGDCTGNQEHIFMSLKVIGNMAAAMGAASPALKSAVIQCVNQPAASPKVQLAAIQAYRQTTLPEEGRQVLMQVLLDGAAPLQKRVAAYLVLMKDPQPAELSQLVAALKVEDSQQAKNFIISHITNILSSTTPETRGLRQKILDALQGNEVGTVNSFDAPKFSRNYKVGSLEGNMIFEGNSYLPKEVVLDMSLNAFGFDVDMFEVGIETNGIEQTSDALFGTDGFFNDIATKSIDHANEMLPGGVMYGMVNMIPPQFYTRKKRKASQSLIKDLRESFHQLLRNLKAQGAPEAMVYLRMLGMELGYLKTEDLERMVLPCLHTVALMIDNLQRSPTDFIQELLPNGDNELFAHYIFMDNEFYLPTGPGVPLRVALSGTFTPGVKGGVHLAADMSEVSFMPSVGIEFVTEVGAHFPDFVQSGLEMRTNIYHESGLKAKVSVSHNNIKLTIPAPQSPTKLISLTNSLVSVHGTKTKAIPPTGDKVDVTECTPFFAGVKYCTALQYSDALHTDDSPYFPFTGDSKLTIQLHPTGEVSEYIANFDHSYEDKTDMVTLTLKAEGLAASESTVTVKFNRRTGSAGIDLQVPDYDLEVGLRLGSVNPNTKGKATHSVQLDLVNKNIPQMSIIVLAKLKEKKDFSVEVQCLVPPVADFKVATHFHYEKDLGLEMKTDLKMLAINYVQNIALKYDEGELAAEIKAELSSEIKNMLSDLKYVETLLNQNIGQTRMRAGTFFRESVEKAHEVIKKYGGEVVRLPAFSELSFPEKLYWKVEADAKYSFGECYTISIPLFEKTSKRHFILPEEFFPEQVSVSVPVLGKAEVSGKVESNFYKLEADFSAGRDPLDHPSYNAKWEVTWTCPSEILSLKTDGSALLVATTSDSLKAELKTHVNHKFIDATITVEEVATIADEFSLMSSCTFEATNPLGVQVSLEHTGDASFNGEVISGNGNLQASLKAGPVYSASTISQTVNIFPYKPKAKSDSSLKIDSTFIASFKNEFLKSDLDYMILRTSKLSDFKLRENLNADLLVASHLDFKGSIETESPIMEIILLTGSEETPLSDIKLDIKANHNIDLPNALIGTLYNSIHAMVKPTEVVLDSQNRAMINLASFQNEGNAQASLKDVTAGKLHLQNDYSVTFNSNVQHASNIGLVRLNQDRLAYNFTVDNNQAEIGIYAAVDGKINLDFLTVPISIPELKVPIIDFRTPAINGINLYEHTGLKHLLTSTDQTVDANAKIIFTKSKNNHLCIFLCFLPNLDRLDSEVSFKSSIMNLNVSSEVTDRNVHIVAISTSMFESLEAKLEYTITFGGWNVATSLSLDNPHVKVTQNSTQAFRKYFSAMAAKVNLPIFTAEVNEQSIFNLKDNTFYNYTYEMVYTVNVPVINAVGSGNVESSTRYELTRYYFSRESSTKEYFDGTILGTGVAKRSLHKAAHLKLDESGLLSTWNITDFAHISYGDFKIELDVNSELPLEIMSGQDNNSAHAIWNINLNNDINMDNLNTKGKHSFKAIFDSHNSYIWDLLESFTVNTEVSLAQLGFLGDLTYFQRFMATKRDGEERATYMSKSVTPVYKTVNVIEMEGLYPTYNGTFHANAQSPAWFLDYDLDGSFTLSIGDEAVNHTVKSVLVLADTDLIVDVQHAVQHLDEGPSYTVNVDITSPFFTDVNVRYAAYQDGANTSISTPSTGSLGFQHQDKSPQMRLYCRYASEPDNDVDLLVFQAALTDNEMLHLHASANVEAPAVILSGLYDRVPAITSSVCSFAEKYKISSTLESLKDMVLSVADEVSNSAGSYVPELSQLSVLFRNVVGQCLKAAQALLDAAIKFLRKTQIDLPGMKLTLLEIVHKIITNVATVLDQLLRTITDNLSTYLTPVFDTVSSIQVIMPSGKVLTGSQILDQVKVVLNSVVDMAKNMESVDVILQKLGVALHEAVDTAQEFVDSVNSDILDSISGYINGFYSNLVILAKWVTEKINNLLNAQDFDNSIKFALESVKYYVTETINFVAQLLPENGLITFNDGRLDVELDIPTQQ
ncbi:hypothetical protein ACEWY4_022258 [Coilia grayii]|uniref:Vitellogenin domain-containing protein n=1 Tax=Coilia grayii TaxID=363190 RepID=A0ABD1J7Z5_9TELE